MTAQSPDQIRLFLTMFLMQLPTFLVCTVAGLVILQKSQTAPKASLWALAGFGLVAILCVLIPLGQMTIQIWVVQGIEPVKRVWAFSALGLTSAILHAVAYALLLVAVFAGRSKAPPSPPGS